MDNLPGDTLFITSKDNDFFKRIKSYALAKNRKRDGVVLVEGKKLYEEAARVLPLYHTLTNEEYSPLPGDAPLKNQVQLSNHLFGALADTKTSQGIIGVFALPNPDYHLAELNRVVVLEGIQDPGNVGTIIRSAHFLGYQAVLLDEACAAPFSPKVIRSSMGAVFHLPCSIAPLKEHLESLKAAGFCIIGGDLQGEGLQKGAQGLAAKKRALLFGSEGQGLSKAALSYCDYRYRIGAENTAAESLNVAVASGIMMYQLAT